MTDPILIERSELMQIIDRTVERTINATFLKLGRVFVAYKDIQKIMENPKI
jgi:hypothetical protein